MDSSYLSNPLIFLIDTLLSLYILAVILRFLLQWVGADFYNPVSQMIVKITHPPLKVLRRFVPPLGKIDSSSLLLALLLQIVSVFSILFLKNISIGVGALIVISFSQLVDLVLNIFIFAIFAQALLSWFNSRRYNDVFLLLDKLTAPVLNQCRKVLPDLGGMDLSPLIALIFLQLLKMMLLPPLQELAGLIG